MPYTLDLLGAWLALPHACVKPASDYFVVPVPNFGSAGLVVWPPDATAETREQAYAEIEANIDRPLPSGVPAWQVPPTIRRVDLPIGPAVEGTYTAPAVGESPPRQALWYTFWINGNLYTFDFQAEPDDFADLERLFRAIANSISLQ